MPSFLTLKSILTYYAIYRSDLAWKKIFTDAQLHLVKEQTQLGLPAGLYEVKM